MLPVPTRDGDWEYACRVYFGDEWLDESVPEFASPLAILESTHNVDPPVLAGPDAFLDESEIRASPEEDEEEESPREKWFEFFRWLGVSPHLRLTPLFDPMQAREYGATEDLGRPSEHHPTLGSLPQSTWDRYRQHLQEAVEASTASERNHHSIYRANRIEYWPSIRDTVREDTGTAIDLFCHISYWWESEFSKKTTVGVGGHKVSAGQVGSRNRGVPNSTERNPLGHNLWIWELRETPWCPTIHGTQYQPTRVWQRTRSLIEQFTIDDRQTVLLPVLPNCIEQRIGEPPGALCQELGIRATIASSDFEPADAEVVCKLLAEFARSVSDREIEQSLPTIRTAYRELASVMPARWDGDPPEAWEESRSELGSTPVICEIGSGEYELREACQALYVTSRGERRQVPLAEPPVFVLEETEAGAYGRHFGMKPLLGAVDTELCVPKSAKQPHLTEKEMSSLEEKVKALRCLLLRDRPSRQKEDRDTLDVFIDEVSFVETLDVVYRLDDLEETDSPEWFIRSAETGGGRRKPYIRSSGETRPESQVERIAKALCEFLDYRNIGDVILVLRAESEKEQHRRLELLDAPQDLLDPEETGSPTNTGSGVISGLGQFQGGSRAGPEVPTLTQTDRRSEYAPDREAGDGPTSNDRVTSSDPAEQLWNPDTLSIVLEDGTEVEGAGMDRSYIPTATGGASSSGSSGAGESSAPGAGGMREAINQVGREIAYNFECSRLRSETGASDPERYVFYIDDRSQIQRARKDLKASPVLRWLTDEQGLDWTYPGFDILTVHPDSDDQNPKADRLIEVKSLKGDGSVDISLNEWYTASNEDLQEMYHLYVVANLGLDSSGLPFVRTVRDPTSILQARPKEQTSISLEVDTKRFSKGGTVKEIPLRRSE